jgi:hypothetical protein
MDENQIILASAPNGDNYLYQFTIDKNWEQKVSEIEFRGLIKEIKENTNELKLQVENYKLEDGTVLKQPLVGDIHIPKDSEMFYRNRVGEKVSAGSLYEAVSKGHVRSVSVEFRPYKGKQITNTKTGITTFKEWDLLRLSLLDVTPGQPYSGIKITRSLINNQNSMPITVDNIKQALESEELTKEELRALLEKEKPTSEQEPDAKEGKQEDEGQRDIIVENDDTPAGEPEPEPENKPEPDPEADTNGDGEVSDKEARAYIQKIKRMYKDPEEIKTRMDELARMCDENKKRMDEMEKPQEIELSDEEKEAQEIAKRALNSNLSDIPKKVESKAGDSKRSLGDEEAGEEVSKRFTLSDMEAEIVKSKLINNK